MQSLTVVATSWCRWIAASHRRILSDLAFVSSSVSTLCLQLPTVVPAYDNVSVWWIPLHIPPAVLTTLTTLELTFGTDEIMASAIYSSLEYCKVLETFIIDFSTAELVGGVLFSLPTLKALEILNFKMSPDVKIAYLQSLWRNTALNSRAHITSAPQETTAMGNH